MLAAMPRKSLGLYQKVWNIGRRIRDVLEKAFPPPFVIYVPIYSLLKGIIKISFRSPTKIANFIAIYGIPEIMAQPISDMLYEYLRLIQTSQNLSRYFKIRELITPAYIVDLSGLALVQDYIYGRTIIPHIEPIAHILARSVDWKLLALHGSKDEEGNQLLRVLIRPKIVRASGYKDR